MNSVFVAAGIVFILLGFSLLVLAMLFSGLSESKVEGAGIVMIGPIPIMFGSAKLLLPLVLLAIILTVLWFFLFFR